MKGGLESESKHELKGCRGRRRTVSKIHGEFEPGFVRFDNLRSSNGDLMENRIILGSVYKSDLYEQNGQMVSSNPFRAPSQPTQM